MPFRINQLTQHRPTKEPQYYKNQQFAQYLAGVIDARGQLQMMEVLNYSIG